MFNNKTFKNSLNSNFINTRETLNGTKILTKKDIQTPLHVINQEVAETIPTSTQESISPIHPTITKPINKNNQTQTTLQSTVKPSVVPNFTQMEYQTCRVITKTRQSQKKNINRIIIFYEITTGIILINQIIFFNQIYYRTFHVLRTNTTNKTIYPSKTKFGII